MSVDDRLINIRAEQALVRRGVDTSKLTVSSSKGNVTISGELKARSKRYEITKGSDMKQIDMSLRRVPNLKAVTWVLQNWKKSGSTWKVQSGKKKKS
ncbi:MAG: hypothetical protein JKX97_01845 [Candidatus Lindowbacteria bacterium]|nr:hypothetical protein [Candidatus Lindowbacteria bacterium]